MFDRIKDSLKSFDESLDDTGVVRKTASAATGKKVIDSKKLEEAFNELELSLISADVDRDVAEYIVEETKKRIDGQKVGMISSKKEFIQDQLKRSVSDVLCDAQADFDTVVKEADKPFTLLFTGVNGVGKTTTIAKLAQRYTQIGYSVVVASGDTYRAGANEQLKNHCKKIDIPVISHERGGDPTAVAYDAVEHAEANNIDIVLIDTAGRLHTSEDLMKQLEKMNRVVDPERTILVDSSTAGQDALMRAKEFNESLDLDGLVLTKTDAVGSGGALLSIPYSIGLPILYIGTGERYEDLQQLDPDEIVETLVNMN